MKKALIIIGIVIGVILVSLTAFVIWATWERDDGGMRAEVDAIKIPGEWKLVAQENVGTINFCPMGGCPSASRKWKLDRAYGARELEGIFGKYVPSLSIDKKCNPSSDADERFIYYCNGLGSSSKYQYYISESQDREGDGYVLSLSVTENHDD